MLANDARAMAFVDAQPELFHRPRREGRGRGRRNDTPHFEEYNLPWDEMTLARVLANEGHMDQMCGAWPGKLADKWKPDGKRRRADKIWMGPHLLRSELVSHAQISLWVEEYGRVASALLRRGYRFRSRFFERGATKPTKDAWR